MFGANVHDRRPLALCLLLALAATTCDDSVFRPPTPTGLGVPRPSPDGYPNFAGSVTVLSVSGEPACTLWIGWTESSDGYTWWVGRDSAAVTLTYDPVDGPSYSGYLDGPRFDLDYTVPGNLVSDNCQLRRSGLVGSFFDDFERFEAEEILVFGPPDRQVVVRRRHQASRR